jgi:sugar-phosphatase
LIDAKPLFARDFAALLFDMDGTLIDSIAVANRVWRGWAERHGIPPAPLLAAMHGVRAVETVARFATPGMNVAAEADAITRAEMDDVDGIVPIADAAAFLDAIPVGRWAIVTSAPRALALRRLAAAGLAPPPLLIAAEDVSNGKPAPDCYRLAAGRLGVDATDCLVFEDAPAGIAAGLSAGAAVLVVTATHGASASPAPHPARPDYRGLAVRPRDDGRLAIVARAA